MSSDAKMVNVSGNVPVDLYNQMVKMSDERGVPMQKMFEQCLGLGIEHVKETYEFIDDAYAKLEKYKESKSKDRWYP